MQAAVGFEEFVEIVDQGSVTAAAEVLGLPRPTVSRRLARLEERLGVRLLHRTTRRLKKTPQGELLYAKARRLVDAAREAAAEVRRLDGVPRGHLRVSIPTGMPHEITGRWVIDFLAAHPEVSLEMVASNIHVDLVAEGFDVALRRGTIEDSSLIARKLFVDSAVAFASLRYLERAGVPERVEDLRHHNCVLGFRDKGVPEQRWPLIDGGSVPVSGTFATGQMALRLEAVKNDLGITMLSPYSVRNEDEQSMLVPVLPGVLGSNEQVSLVYVDREFLEPKVRAFIDFFAERIKVTRERSARAARGR